MSRVRVSTTVDENLLADARRALEGQPDAVVIDEALRSLLRRHRSAELDAEYAAYDAHRLESPTSGATWRRFATQPPRPDGPALSWRAVVVRATTDWTTTRSGVLTRRGESHGCVEHLSRRARRQSVALAARCGLNLARSPFHGSAVNLDSLASVSIAVLVDRIGRLSDDRMRQICAALEVTVDCQR